MVPVLDNFVVRSSQNWFWGDQRDIPAGARATGGCCYGDHRAEIAGDFT